MPGILSTSVACARLSGTVAPARHWVPRLGRGARRGILPSMSDLFGSYPYRDQFPTLRALPEQGRDREEVRAELAAMAEQEAQVWQTG